MEQNKSFSNALNRITVIDALRGFALLGIIMIHMSQHYGIFSFSGMGFREPQFPALDAAIGWLNRNVIMGKFINIFAFLFGLSFFIQMDRAAKKGSDFRLRFLWRMVILFVIGIIGNCFYTGDILSIYAVFGAILVFLYKFKNWVLIVIASLLLLGAPRLVMTGYDQITKTEQTDNVQPRQGGRQNQGNNRAAFRGPRIQEKPSFINSAKNNLTSGLQGKLNYQFGSFGRGYITLALFVLGLVVGRVRFFENVQTQQKRNWILLGIFALAFILLKWITSLFPQQSFGFMMPGEGGISASSRFAVTVLNDVSSVVLSGVLALGFIVLHQLKGIGKCLDKLAPYGRMGLTNYEMQGVLGAIIFSMWGLGSIFGNWGTTEVFALGLGIYIVQVIISKYWLKYFLYGPFEWLWRSATYLKLQPFKKTPSL